MAKTMTMQTEQTEAEGTASDETKKQRKKLAKREAKMMLKVEQARKDVQKAERKVAQTQAELEATKTHLSKLEAHVQELSTPSTSSSTTTKKAKSSKSAKSAAAQAQEASAQTNSGNHKKAATDTAVEATTPVTADETNKATFATPMSEPEQPALLSPDVAHTDTAQVSTEAQSTPMMEENSESADEPEDTQHTQESPNAE